MSPLPSPPRDRPSQALALTLILTGLLGATTPAAAKVTEDILKLPVTVTNAWGKTWTQDMVVTVFAETEQPRPRALLVILHGRATDAAGRQALGRARYSDSARWFARMGFVVAVPTRVGYGVTGGEDVEDSGSCSQRMYPPVYAAAADETEALMRFMRQRPDVKADHGVLLGQSFGGMTVVALAARNPAGVSAILNFAGGGGGNPELSPEQPCNQPALERLYADYGRSARTPVLWSYAQNDLFWGPKLPREWFQAFHNQGGVGEFQAYPPVGKNGHSLFTAAPELWRPVALAFLRAHGFPDLKEPPAAAPGTIASTPSSPTAE
ncbi:dienelactone hydrolase family protein [Ideonella sp. B508-1]|uniref:dienelactone hydrolase family protein n=1 Tax=Ideonella sp. B508-1 TaxID=137716 RepID=UPI00034D4707|nr:alpha/beta hydrolase [Ideonella sp. B508-1]